MTELLATMPVLPLTADCQVRFEAVDPATGAVVGSVTVSRAVIYATDTEGTEAATVNVGPYMLVPGPPAGGKA